MKPSEFSIEYKDLQKMREAASRTSVAPTTKQRGLFLKGPIQLAWLIKACRLPGKSLHVGITLWFLCGLQKTKRVAPTRSVLRRFGIDRHSAYRALKALENAGLVKVDRQAGRSPVVTLQDVTE